MIPDVAEVQEIGFLRVSLLGLQGDLAKKLPEAPEGRCTSRRRILPIHT